MRALFVPTGFYSDEELEQLGGEDQTISNFELLSSLNLEAQEVEQRELTHSSLQKMFSRVGQGKGSHWEKLKHHPLSEYPKLGTLRGRMLYVQKGKVGFLKERVLKLTLDLLLQEIRSQSHIFADEAMLKIEHETFDDEWLRLFENDDISLDGRTEEIYPVDRDDPLEHLLPVIEESWVLPQSFFVPDLMKTLIEI